MKYHLSNLILLLWRIEFIILSWNSSETFLPLRRIANLQQLMRMLRIEIFGSFTHSSHDLTVKPFSCPNQTLPSDLCVVPWTATRRMKNTDKRRATTFRHTTVYYTIRTAQFWIRKRIYQIKHDQRKESLTFFRRPERSFAFHCVVVFESFKI